MCTDDCVGDNLMEKHKVKLQLAREAESWFKKGIVEDQEKMNQTAAIICYKQALVCDLEFYPAMFNLAACYERKNWLTATKKWLTRIIEVNPEFQHPYEALCRTCMKLGLFEEANRVITQGY